MRFCSGTSSFGDLEAVVDCLVKSGVLGSILTFLEGNIITCKSQEKILKLKVLVLF